MFARRAAVLTRGCRYLRANHYYYPPTNPSHFPSLTSRAFAAVNAAMADTANTSGITADSLKDKLVTQLQAQHVEIEDMSGTRAISCLSLFLL